MKKSVLLKIIMGLIMGLFFANGFILANNMYGQDVVWQQTGPIYGGDIQSIAINASGDIFAGTYGSGIFRSSDNGESWTDVNIGLTNYNIIALEINYIGDVFVVNECGLFRSIDNGDNWTIVFEYSDILSIAINTSNDIFIGTYGSGIYCSSDNGGTWAQVTGTLPPYIIYSLSINTNGDIFAGAKDSEIFRSTDNGASWMQVYSGSGWTTFVLDITINENTGVIFVATSIHGEILRSTDNGENWSQLNIGWSDFYIAKIGRAHV